jgi:multidrug efflux pump subunit AcrA (membrane-fusion protein)
MQMRARALEQRRLPDELDRLLTVASARSSLAVIALAMAVAGLVAWGLFGHLPREVSAQGVLSGAQGPRLIQSTTTGQVAEVFVQDGQALRPGTPVVRLTGQRRPILAPFGGRVVGVAVAPGEVVQPGSPLYTSETPQPRDQPPQALLFLAPSNAPTVAPGMTVNLSVASAPAARYGVVRGRVASVSSYPATTQTLTALLGNENLAQLFSRNGPPVVAVVSLRRDPRTPSGVSWSTAHGAPFALQPGVDVSAQIIQGQQTPVKVVFGG